MRKLLQAGWFALALLTTLPATAADAPLPPALRDWQSWVLNGQEFRRCPFIANGGRSGHQPIPDADYRCVWPERLTLSVDSRGGTFSQRWQVYAESWVTLPGDERYWPRDVRVNGESMSGAAILAGDIAVVNRARSAIDYAIVLALLDGEFTIKRFRKRGARIWLQAEHPSYPDIEINEEMSFEVWGVVSRVVRLL